MAATATAPATATETTTPLLLRRFPPDVESEILACLPVKTLKRFQSVCKSWYSLISSPQFHKRHVYHSMKKPPLLITLKNDRHPDARPDESKSTLIRFPGFRNPRERSLIANVQGFDKFLPHEFYDIDSLTLKFSSYTVSASGGDKHGTITPCFNFDQFISHPLFDSSMAGKPFVLSCRGLLCLASWSVSNPPILICNPSINQIISLPATKEPNSRVGFGYAAGVDEFKVVRFFSDGVKKKSRCEVLTLGSGEWRKAKFAPYRVSDGTAPFLHGAVHCLPETCSTEGVNKTNDVVAVFDIESEKYRESIRLPPFYYTLGKLGDRKRRGIVDVKNFMRLTVLGGSLCLTFDYGELKCRLDLYLLKNYVKGEWVKEYTIDVSAIFPYPSFSFWAYPTDNMLGRYIFLNCSDQEGIKLLGYDPESKTLELKRDNEWGAAFYAETLVPLI